MEPSSSCSSSPSSSSSLSLFGKYHYDLMFVSNFVFLAVLVITLALLCSYTSSADVAFDLPWMTFQTSTSNYLSLSGHLEHTDYSYNYYPFEVEGWYACRDTGNFVFLCELVIFASTIFGLYVVRLRSRSSDTLVRKKAAVRTIFCAIITNLLALIVFRSSCYSAVTNRSNPNAYRFELGVSFYLCLTTLFLNIFVLIIQLLSQVNDPSKLIQSIALKRIKQVLEKFLNSTGLVKHIYFNDIEGDDDEKESSYDGQHELRAFATYPDDGSLPIA